MYHERWKHILFPFKIILPEQKFIVAEQAGGDSLLQFWFPGWSEPPFSAWNATSAFHRTSLVLRGNTHNELCWEWEVNYNKSVVQVFVQDKFLQAHLHVLSAING